MGLVLTTLSCIAWVVALGGAGNGVRQCTHGGSEHITQCGTEYGLAWCSVVVEALFGILSFVRVAWVMRTCDRLLPLLAILAFISAHTVVHDKVAAAGLALLGALNICLIAEHERKAEAEAEAKRALEEKMLAGSAQVYDLGTYKHGVDP